MKIIAEVGSNWKTRDDLVQAVNLAKACKADVVKFQWLDHFDLYGYENPSWELQRYTLDIPTLERIKAKCDAVSIELMVSTFHPRSMRTVDPYVTTHKIAGSEFMNKRLYEQAKKLGKPILISMGGHNVGDLAKLRNYLDNDLGYTNYEIMYCVSEYPTKQTNLHVIKDLALQGFSDHTIDIDTIAVKAKELGATVFEKHFNPFNYPDTPDAAHALNVKEFKNYVKALKGMHVDPAPQHDMKLRHNKRLIATRDIFRDEELVEDANFGIFRAKENDHNGSSPMFVDQIIGKRATRDIKRGEGIFIKDVR